jgi:uracil-DNA glycosylase
VQSLAELRARLTSFEGCGLKATAKNLCLYRGAEQAPLMIIGEGTNEIQRTIIARQLVKRYPA